MYCALCKQNKDPRMEILGLIICRTCMKELVSTSVATKKYDYYKEVVKETLRNYIYEKLEINPVK